MQRPQRRYYTDAYTTRFNARISERLTQLGQPAVVLEETYFYPVSGGQPADSGILGGQRVLDVSVREEDGAIVHVLHAMPAEDIVDAAVDWERRFDHMQQHTGQHILSQAFLRVSEAETMGFHLSPNSVTIDLAVASLEDPRVRRAEELANQIVWEDRSVTVSFVNSHEVGRIGLRSLPERNEKELRLIEVEDFDLTACGGTHVRRTGSVGLIKVLRQERIRDQTRVHFCCGRRAVDDYTSKHDAISALAADFTTAYTEVPRAIDALRTEADQVRHENRQLKERLADFEAEQMLASATSVAETRIVSQVLGQMEPAELRLLANRLTESPQTVALLALSGETTHLVFARGADVPGDMNELLQVALRVIGTGGGGGNSTFAQGGGPRVDAAVLEEALHRSEQALIANLRS